MDALLRRGSRPPAAGTANDAGTRKGVMRLPERRAGDLGPFPRGLKWEGVLSPAFVPASATAPLLRGEFDTSQLNVIPQRNKVHGLQPAYLVDGAMKLPATKAVRTLGVEPSHASPIIAALARKQTDHCHLEPTQRAHKSKAFIKSGLELHTSMADP